MQRNIKDRIIGIVVAKEEIKNHLEKNIKYLQDKYDDEMQRMAEFHQEAELLAVVNKACTEMLKEDNKNWIPVGGVNFKTEREREHRIGVVYEDLAVREELKDDPYSDKSPYGVQYYSYDEIQAHIEGKE